MNTPKISFVASLLFFAAALAPQFASAQAGDELDELAARRQAILQQDELVASDGQFIERGVEVVPATRATFRSSADSSPFQEVRWRRGYGGYYGGYNARPYGAYYGGARSYARYPSYYDPYYGGGYGGNGYRAYGPRNGYYGQPYYGGRPYGAARVGPLRVIW